MCGIVGFVGGGIEGPSAILEKMKEAVAHRGPDGQGTYVSSSEIAALGHRRLAILDPEHGQQPMVSPGQEVALVFNGCIYNYLELRRELLAKGHPIKSYSDTEVILYSYLEWGEDCVKRFNGMFAFAVWDERTQALFCARDRIGIKPFYYSVNDGVFAFASEIKALFAGGLVNANLNTDGLKDYIAFQYCLGEKTLFKDVERLEPGYTMHVQFVGGEVRVKTRQYWDMNFDIDETKTEADFIDRLEELVEDSIRLQLRSDVPIGAHLSGGLDSSAVVCQATSLLDGSPFQTFTGAFREGREFDETEYARIVAERTGAKYHETFISGGDFSSMLPKLMWHMDEPLAGPGLFPQYYVSKLAADNVKVVMGGQGGDELFVGYARYMVAYLEKCLNGAIFETSDESKYAVSLESIVPNLPVLKQYRPMLQGFWREGLFGPDDERYFKLIDRSEGMKSLFNDEFLSGNDYKPFHSFQKIFNRDGLHSLVNRISYFDLKASLPALLHVEDRTSMSVSLESRVPLLDHRIVELMGQVPPNIKFANGRLKHLFKEAVKHKVPNEILTRKDKMGFPVPLNHWYKGEAKDFVADVLLSQRAKDRGLYNTEEVERFLNKQASFSRVIWGMISLELWFREFIDA